MSSNLQRSKNNIDICKLKIEIKLQIIDVLKWATVI